MINRFYFLIGKEISIYIFILLLTLIVSTVLELIGIGLFLYLFHSFQIRIYFYLNCQIIFREKISFINNMEKIELIFLFSIFFFVLLIKKSYFDSIGIIESAIIYKTKIFHTKNL